LSGVELLVAVGIAIGITGIVIPFLPGSLLVLLAILGWAFSINTSASWVTAVVAAGIIVAGLITKFAIPGRQLKDRGVPNSTLWVAALLGIVGFFVIPVVGLLVGFVVGIYLAEYKRLGKTHAWPSTRSALSAVGLSILIELTAAVAAAVVWGVGVAIT
jgi:uncharacterized protein